MRSTLLIFSLVIFLGPSWVSAQGANDEQLAAQYFLDKEYDKAVVIYEALFEKNPSPVVYNNFLESLLALEEFRKAERIVRNLLKDKPGVLRYEVDLGMVLLRSGNERRSRRHFEGLIRNLESSPGKVNELAEAFENRGFNDLALETYLRGRRMLGNAHPFHLKIASLYEKESNYTSMMEEYIDFLNANLREMDRVRGILQDAINNDPGYHRNEALREVLLTRTQRQPNNTLYSEMLLWLSLQQKDFSLALMQARALDRRMGHEGQLLLEVAMLAAANASYQVAAKAFGLVLEKGESSTFYLEALTGFLDVRFLEVTTSYDYSSMELILVEKEYQEALDQLGVNANTIRLVRNLANLQAFYLGKTDEATALLNTTLSLPGVSNRIQGECKVELADILLLNGQVWEATLLYSQVDKTFKDDPLAHEAKFKNARLSFYIGEFDWAKAQLDILKSGTSRLIANDAMKLSLRIQDNIGFDGQTRPLEMFAKAEMFAFRNQPDSAIVVLDSVLRLFPAHPIHDDVLFAKAAIFLRKGDYKQADSLLTMVVELFPSGLLADEALFQRAELHQQIFNNKEQAMALYQKILVNYPGSLNTVTARNRFRTLRGDMVN